MSAMSVSAGEGSPSGGAPRGQPTPLWRSESHAELLAGTLGRQLGELAARVVRVLAAHGPLTLPEVAEWLRRMPPVPPAAAAQQPVRSAAAVSAAGARAPPLADAALVETMERLVQHRVAAAATAGGAAAQRRYELRLGDGLLLRACWPLAAHAALARHGGAAMAVLCAVQQLGVSPLSVAREVAAARLGSGGGGAAAVGAAGRALLADGWLERVGPALGGKRTAAEGPDGGGDDALVRVSVPRVLEALWRAALLDAAADRHPGGARAAVAAALAAVLDARDRPPTTWPAAPRAGYPAPPVSRVGPLPADAAVREALLGGVPQSRDRAPPLLTTSFPGADGGGGSAHECAVNGAEVAAALRLAACERAVHARHGVLGARLLRLLLRHQLLEDTTLSEEAVIPLARTHQLLHAMAQDGYVAMQEVPRTAAPAPDRVAKTSTFLWRTDLQGLLLPAVREQTARALINCLARIDACAAAAAAQDLDATDGAEGSSGSGGGGDASARSPEAALTAAAARLAARLSDLAGAGAADARATAELLRKVRDEAHAHAAVMALQSSALSLMRLMLVLDYF